MMFDTFVMVDWSAATVPRTGRDSIWICWHAKDGERLENPPTRHAAKSILGDWLATAVATRRAGSSRLRLPVRLSRRLRRPARSFRAALARRLGRDRAVSSTTPRRTATTASRSPPNSTGGCRTAAFLSGVVRPGLTLPSSDPSTIGHTRAAGWPSGGWSICISRAPSLAGNCSAPARSAARR